MTPDTPSAKSLRVERIESALARALIRSLHYSGRVVQNSQVHFGVRPGPGLPIDGALSFGPPLDRSKVIGLVVGTRAHEFMELNRMAFGPSIPRNGESRALSVALRLLKKERPALRWILSYADGCQCGDGAIYRATGLVLTAIKRNDRVYRMPDGDVRHAMTFENCRASGTAKARHGREEGSPESVYRFLQRVGAVKLDGFMLRYIYFFDPSDRRLLTVPEIPFAEIGKAGASMYKGIRVGSIEGDAPTTPGRTGRFDPDPDA